MRAALVRRRSLRVDAADGGYRATARIRAPGALRAGRHRVSGAPSGVAVPGPAHPVRAGGSKPVRATRAANSASSHSESEQIRSANPAVVVSVAVCISEPPVPRSE
ncbi:hypothetical protein KNO15_13045 [Leifsonia shinshuensis]|uniref:hypothetical protein n=1 Tax=Leifsonia shinshuensis TaxID=150026 RepID=UPI001F507E5A|nr:hypothetical protein [Leifsonia shinshuensis]MCI0157621.1 hypothetical protein [Leifsonia shinshuensis]